MFAPSLKSVGCAAELPAVRQLAELSQCQAQNVSDIWRPPADIMGNVICRLQLHDYRHLVSCTLAEIKGDDPRPKTFGSG